MQPAVKELVRSRAGKRCEYCRLQQEHAPFATFQVEHIRAKQHGGGDEPENLALACHRCNAFKGPNLSGVDDVTGEVELLFNPRVDHWAEHFEWEGPLVVGRTPTGRATVAVLNMNEEQRVLLRQRLMDLGEFE